MKKKFMKKRFIGMLAVLAVIITASVFGLTGCREMSEADVIGRLSTNLDEATSYVANGRMEVESEGQIHSYFVEVGFMSPNYYRVSMRNEATGNEQIILKNDDGVFVLTPALNKQFKFQSDWPQTSSQVYLYQSLLSDLLNAQVTTFEATDDHYIFTVGANYDAGEKMIEQVMQFDRKYLTPTFIEVKDDGGVTRMSMDFASFEWNKVLADDFFVAESIMELALSVMGDGEAMVVVNVEEAMLYPTYVPEGSSLVDKTTLATAHGERVIMTFAGEHEFTIIQETSRIREASTSELILGEPVMVNGTVAAITENTLTWQRNGVEFFMVSNTLDRDQLVTVAASIAEGYGK